MANTQQSSNGHSRNVRRKSQKKSHSRAERVRLDLAKITWGAGITLCVVSRGQLQMFSMTKAQHRALMASGFRL